MGVLSGIRVLEFEAIGPGPFGAMLMADMGADVIRVDRPVAPADLGPKKNEGARRIDITGRGRRSVTLDLKQRAALALIERADVVLEGFRPGTMERLGLGPEVALARNPKLVYGRMTGWGACVAPVLEFSEAPRHPHHGARGSFIEIDGVVQPAPAPRFLGTPSEVLRGAPERGQHGAAALRDWGFDSDGIAQLRAMGLGALGAS
ncbi:CoA transferase [Cupriavidus sp. amp6]|uniref:CoA transferase n=1 Tax=Cupriavidus sp. amp6 TaxID=388051 RepID=UPI0003FDBFC3|nr:CoA transferase [Cupriavidus sp. amp6]